MHIRASQPEGAASALTTAPPPITYNLNDAARVTGLSRSTLYRHAAAGRLRLIKCGGRTLVDAASLRALLGVTA